MGGRSSKVKGSGFEREVVALLHALGVEAERVPLSGAAKGSYAADLRLGPDLHATGEAKRRARGFTPVYDALAQDDADFAFLRDDRRPPIVAMSWETFVRVITALGWTDPARATLILPHKEPKA